MFRQDLMSNRRGAGELAIILIFVVALVLSVTALFYFVSFNKDLTNNFKAYDWVSNEAELAESYIKLENDFIIRETIVDKAVSDIEVKSYYGVIIPLKQHSVKRDLGYTGMANYFLKLRNNEFIFNKINCSGKMEYVFEMKGITYKIIKYKILSDESLNEVSLSRTLDICKVYDSTTTLINDRCESAAKVMADCGI